MASLDLDTIVWAPGEIAVLRPLEDVERDLMGFVSSHSDWVVEGCYGELAEKVLPWCDRLIFLDPGPEVCLAHNRARPWEPHKYASREAQDAMLANLLDWTAGYYERDDSWSQAAHRRLYDNFPGPKELRT